MKWQVIQKKELKEMSTERLIGILVINSSNGVDTMARKTSDGKYIPVVYDKGFVDMVELKDGEWKVVEYNTLKEAEQKEKEYKEFWQNANR